MIWEWTENYAKYRLLRHCWEPAENLINQSTRSSRKSCREGTFWIHSVWHKQIMIFLNFISNHKETDTRAILYIKYVENQGYTSLVAKIPDSDLFFLLLYILPKNSRYTSIWTGVAIALGDCWIWQKWQACMVSYTALPYLSCVSTQERIAQVPSKERGKGDHWIFCRNTRGIWASSIVLKPIGIRQMIWLKDWKNSHAAYKNIRG